MAVKLISRQRFIPGGFIFYIPPLKWQSRKMISFDQVVQSATAAIRANPAVSRQLSWDLSYAAMADRIDEFNARVCEANGWTDYYTGGPVASLPKSLPRDQALNLQSLKNAAVLAKELVRGAKTLVEWLDSGEPAVVPILAAQRAAVCAGCPMNEPGDLTKWFTVPAAELIRRQVEKAGARKLSTPSDEKLNLCVACHCPLRLKVHVPIGWITKRLSLEQTAKLKQAPACWIVAEGKI